VEDRLSELGETLPPAKTPVANYLGCKVSANTLYVSGRVSQTRSAVGSDIDLARGQQAAAPSCRLALLYNLSWL